MTTNGSPYVLLVDDAPDICELVSQYLEKNGMKTVTASAVADARRILAKEPVDIVILDILMPGENGLGFCRELREGSSIPIILLTSMSDATDRIVGLELGADDYLTKPFASRELLARIRSILRRSTGPGNKKPDDACQVLVFHGWEFHEGERTLKTRAGVTVPISTAEFKLLKAFLNHPRQVLSRDQLQDLAHGRDGELFERSIDNQISRLRRKIEVDPKLPAIIQTVWGAGYMLAATVEKRT